MHSDNGTNFVGAEHVLQKDLEAESFKEKVKDKCRKEGINWKFQPPAAPHFGGAHERLVRSVKRKLYRVLEIENKTLRNLTEEVLRTLLFKITGLLNRRPLTYSISDEDFRPITPNDLLYRPSQTRIHQDCSTVLYYATVITTSNV